MSYFNIDIDKVVIEVKKKAEDMYINECRNPEKDEDGQYPTPSLDGAIETALTNYFDSNYEEIPEGANKEYEDIYNKLYERVSKDLDKGEILESLSQIPGDYYGLTEYQRNSSKY